jgi:hypothetical protein
MKVCACCTKAYDESEFKVRNKRTGLLASYCISCVSEKGKQTYIKHKANKQRYAREHSNEIKQYRQEYYLKNRVAMMSSNRAYYSLPENRVKKLLSKAKERAALEKWEFSLTIDDITIPEVCPYLGIPLTHTYGQGQLESNSSIDRINSSRGYVPGNVQVISRLANTMKSNASVETLQRFAQGIINMHGLEGTSVTNYTEAFTKYFGA